MCVCGSQHVFEEIRETFGGREGGWRVSDVLQKGSQVGGPIHGRSRRSRVGHTRIGSLRRPGRPGRPDIVSRDLSTSICAQVGVT